ncbi:MAG: CvpA family protein [Treponema sp.]|nr:CvpA family protein [Treponema sp.]
MMIGMLDIIFFVVILITSVAAAYRGFIKEVLGKAAWVLAVLLSVFLYKNVAVLFESSIKSETLRYICSFVCLFLGVFLIVKIVEIILSKIFSGEITGGLNRAMGFLFGIAEGLVFVFAFLFVLHVQPWFNTKGITEDSIFNNFFEQKIEKTVYPEIIIPAFTEDPSGEDA